MFETFKTIIEAGGYALADLLARIRTMYATGDLTEAQLGELTDLAREHADPEDSYAPVLERVTALERWQADVESRLAALESDTGGTGEPAPEPSDEWPEYVQPTGAHDAYHTGDRITWQGRHYTCTMDGCVWSPTDYPQAWKEEA